MKKFLNKKLNKKGFTLAELLIVIAILAVLVAIAVPIFSTQLQKAKEARDSANIRSVKAAAITLILTDDELLQDGDWFAQATVDEQGDISDLQIVGNGTTSVPGEIDYTEEGNVVVQITALDLDPDAY